MQKVKRIEGLDSEPLPSDYFDMMCGTGTGGLVFSSTIATAQNLLSPLQDHCYNARTSSHVG